jgi:hypothetical protein
MPKQFPGQGTSAPQEAACCGQPGDKCAGSAGEYADPIWEALAFNARDPHHFRPTYAAEGTGLAAAYTATTYADLDCDGIYSTFQRGGSVTAGSGDVTAATAAYVDKEIE